MCSGNFEPKWLFKIFIFLLMNIISQNMYQQYLLSKHTCIKHLIHLKWNETQNMHFTYTHTHTENRALVFHMGIRHSDIICLHGNAPEVKETEKF